MVTTLSLHQQTIVVSTLIVLLLTQNKALPGGRPRITRFVLILITCLNKAQSCFHAPFICPCMLWFECLMHNTFMGVLNQAWCLG